MLGWLVDKHGIEPHVTVFDESARKDGTFLREASVMTTIATSTFAPRRQDANTTGTRVNDNATLLYPRQPTELR